MCLILVSKDPNVGQYVITFSAINVIAEDKVSQNLNQKNEAFRERANQLSDKIKLHMLTTYSISYSNFCLDPISPLFIPILLRII